MEAKRWRNCAIGTIVSILANCAFAQAYPSKPVRVIVPYPPGTGVDVITRNVLEVVSKNVGQPFIFETRTGAAGTVATNFVAKATPDGYTLVTNSAAHTTVPAMMANLPYDPANDLAGITTLAELPLVLIVNKATGIQTVRDLIAAAKAKQGGFNFASGGIGTTAHLAGEKFRLSAGFDATHIPFSSTDGVPEVMGGRIDFMYTAVVTALSGVNDGRLVALAMSSKRASALPNVPTIEEAGVPNSAYNVWLGLLVAAKTPRDAVNRLHQEVVRALASPELRERMLKVGAEPSSMAPADFDALIRRQLVENAQLVQKLGIKPQ